MIYNQSHTHFFSDLAIDSPLDSLTKRNVNTESLKQEISELCKVMQQVTDRIEFCESWHSFDIEPELNMQFLARRFSTPEEIKEYELEEHEQIEYGVGKKTKNGFCIMWTSGETPTQTLAEYENKELYEWKYI